MTEDKGKSSPKSGKERGDKKEKLDKNKKRSSERSDYAKEMWGKIKKANASKDKREDLKKKLKTGTEDVKTVEVDDGDEVDEVKIDQSHQSEDLNKSGDLSESGVDSAPKKKKRRRRRRKKNKTPEQVPSAPIDTAIKAKNNEDEVLPNSGYGSVIDMEADDEGGLDSDMEGQNEEDLELDGRDPVFDEELNPFTAPPINPFNEQASSTFEDRTLEKKSPVLEGKELEIAEDNSAENFRQSEEIVDPNSNVSGSFLESSGAKNDFNEEIKLDHSDEESVVEADKVEEAEVVTDPLSNQEVNKELASESENLNEEESGAAVVQEVIRGKADAEVKIPSIDQANEFKEDFWEILDHAGITKTKIIAFGIGLVVLIFAFVAFLLWPSGDAEIANTVVNKVELEDTAGQGSSADKDSVVNENSNRDSASSADLSGVVPYDIVSSFIFGLEFKPEVGAPIVADPIVSWADISGIDSVLIFGRPDSLFRIEFVEFMDLLKAMENIYNTDVYELVNLSPNRREMLNDHITTMRDLIEKGEAAIAKLDARMEVLSSQYDVVAADRDQYEERFFDYADQLYGQNAYENLNNFIERSEDSNKIKAQFEAQKLLRSKFVSSLRALIPRYEDIVANKEALLKGVRVFDLPGSNIDAIIPLDD